MTNSSSKHNCFFLRPFAIVIYSFLVANGLYALRNFIFANNEYVFSTLVAYNVGCGLVFLLGWYACLAWSVKSPRIAQTFSSRLQYVLVNLLGIIPINIDTDLFVRWQVKPFELEGLQIMMHSIVGYVMSLGILGILCLFMLKCRFPVKMTLRSTGGTLWSLIACVFLYTLCGILLIASMQCIYSGVYYQASLYWMLIYTIVSVISGKTSNQF